MKETTGEAKQSALPYLDTKAIGAADFYFAINATFRFILARFGEAGLRRYWAQLGENYMAPVWRNWQVHGLPGIAAYWRDFFSAEPGSNVSVVEEKESVVLEVHVCPAIRHLREHNREIVPQFCQHYYFVSEAAAQRAGFTVRVKGGNGSCRQIFTSASAAQREQNIDDIRIASTTRTIEQ